MRASISFMDGKDLIFVILYLSNNQMYCHVIF